ncbi:RDD family protein [Oceaniovalibus guishaninsula]|nr:RDD family protein [Oceaniovalibus guishaninsula]
MTAIGLPDPTLHAAFYDSVPTKRLLAWVLDFTLIALLSLVLMPLTLFTAIFYFPVFFLVIGIAYRWVTLARGSATWGMRALSIELRDLRGQRLDPITAFLHTALYTAAMAFFPAQLISVALMLITPRGQGLVDLALGTAMINRAADD